MIAFLRAVWLCLISNRKAWIIAASIGWSPIAVITKLICNEYGAYAMTSSRSGIYGMCGFAYLFLMIRNSNRRSGFNQSWYKNTLHVTRNVFFCWDGLHWLCAGAACVNIILITEAFLLRTAANATFVNSGALIIIAALSGPFLNHYPNRKEWWAIGLGSTGIGLLAFEGFSWTSYQGTVLGIGCALSLAVCQICMKRRTMPKPNIREAEEAETPREIRGTEGMESYTLCGFLLAIGLSGSMLSAGLPSLGNGMLIAALGTITTCLPDALFVLAVSGENGVPLVQAMVISRLSPVLTPIWTWYILGEKVSTLTLGGASFVTLAIILLAFWGKRSYPSNPYTPKVLPQAVLPLAPAITSKSECSI